MRSATNSRFSLFELKRIAGESTPLGLKKKLESLMRTQDEAPANIPETREPSVADDQEEISEVAGEAADG